MKPILVPAILSSLCLAALVACDDGGSSSGPEGDSSEALSSETSSAGSSSSAPKKLTVETYDDLPSCNLDREGTKAFVKDENLSYVCDVGYWTEIPEKRSSSGKSGKRSSSSSRSGASSSSSSNSSSSGGSGEQTYAFGYALKNAPRPSAGCGKTVALGDHFQFTGGGVEHEVYLNLPENYDRNRPYRLVFGFHYMGGSAEAVAKRENYYGLRNEPGAKENTIFVAPHGYTVETDTSGHETSNPWRCKDSLDHPFFAELLTYLNENLCIDTSRVFAVGFSFGAMMANSLAQDFQDRLRGVVAFATMDQVIYLPKNKGLPIAWMGTVGMDDPLCTPKLGRSARDRILKNNGLPDGDGNFGDARDEEAEEWTSGNHVCYDYRTVDPRFPVKWCTFDGEHTYLPRENGEVWTARTGWEFIAQF